MSTLILHGYWRSSAAYRVRIALNLKGIPYQQVGHNLRSGAQREEGYLSLAPHGLVPALEVDGSVLIESPAILEWIEARWPSPPLLPKEPWAAATVRAMAALVSCDIHPLNNLRVLNELRASFGADDDSIKAWARNWIEKGFGALERMIAQDGGLHAFGDMPTLADCYLVPQLYSARRFGVDLTPYPRLVAAAEASERLPAVAAAHPRLQPDADSP
jgi:maleylpyruvate isomerase